MKKYINRPYVYLITDGKYYKIGCSLNPFRRLKQLQTANPNCRLLGYTKKYTEQQLHNKYKKYKFKKEWFKLPYDEVKTLLDVMHKPKIKKTVSQFKDMELNSYIIPYGEYKGRKLNTMNSIDEIRYLRKQIRELPRKSEEWVMFTRWSFKWSEENSIK